MGEPSVNNSFPSNGHNAHCEIRILVEPNDVTAQVGSYVNLSAVVRISKPSFQWYNEEGKSIPDRNESNLLIGPITQEDFGFYRLSIVDEITNNKILTRWVEIIDQDSKVINSQKDCVETTDNKYDPILIVHPQGGTFHKGATISLTAHFINARYYQWYKDGESLINCTGNTLVINRAVFENTGKFMIVASNEYNVTANTTVKIQIV